MWFILQQFLHKPERKTVNTYLNLIDTTIKPKVLGELDQFPFRIKSPVMQFEKPLINDRLRVSKLSGKIRVPTIYNFAVIYP